MEGVLDHDLREVLTQLPGINRCVSEFIRVTDQVLPQRVFLRICPELGRGGRTRSGVPVRPQLLGSDPTCLAENAAALAMLEPPGIDLNFGCPAKVVNRHGGGAMLLDDPDGLTRIVAAVRRAVPAHIPVSAKMRLGTDDDARAVECAQALADGGAAEIVVHARTRAQGYRPPAHWARIADLSDAVSVPLVANGEIWTVEDAAACRQASGCQALMIGRGLVADPSLALRLTIDDAFHLDDATLGALLHHYWAQVSARVEPRHRAGRIKQWLNFLRRRYPLAEQAYQALRAHHDGRSFGQALAQWFPLTGGHEASAVHR
ncbi:MAG: tRNA-dihydrouridine synthase [Burkholderiales bacterium]|nr:tRNA-dihydrouridine synthase [Burkholderiales bacterium]